MSKILSTAVVVGLLFVVAAPAFAADAPKTKAQVREADRHEVGCEDQDVREEVNRTPSSQKSLVKPREKTQMKRVVGLSLMAGVLFTCMAASSGQATPISPIKLAPAVQSSGIVSQAYWRHRHCRCWWRWGHRHCRCWR